RVPRESAYFTSERKRKLSFGLRAVAFFEFLAAAAPAGVVATDVLAVRLDDRARGACGRRRSARQRHGCRRGGRRRSTGGGNRVCAGERLVLVLETAAVDGARLLRTLQLVRFLRRKLRMEQRQHDLFVDR